MDHNMATVTVKNIPDDLYSSLKNSAQLNRRSINSELIRCLEHALQPGKLSPQERLARIDAIRPDIPVDAIDPEEISAAIKNGRA